MSLIFYETYRKSVVAEDIKIVEGKNDLRY